MNVNLKDVASRAGLSVATVSLALSGSDKVSKSTRQRVEKLAREMGYRPNLYARKLVTRRSRQIGLIVPDIENVYYASLAQRIFNDLTASGYGLMISTSMNSRLTERRIICEMIENRVDALMIAPVNTPNSDAGYLAMLDEAGIPLLFVTSAYPGADRPCVMCDLYGGMRSAVGTLYAGGCRRMALVSGTEGVYSLDLRVAGYRDFLRENGIAYEQVYHLDNVRYEDAYALIRGMDGPDADAYICVNDMMALGVVNALLERGVRVPEDVSVIGYDDVIFSAVSQVPITTVRQDIRRIAAEAVNRVLDMAQGNAHGRVSGCVLPCELIEKRSTRGRSQ